MGGHNAWRKRLDNGELAKQGGGAICRHRPHLGRKGKDIEKSKKGNINGGPNKKKNKKQMTQNETDQNAQAGTIGQERIEKATFVTRFIMNVVVFFTFFYGIRLVKAMISRIISKM
jgi:hypothetical protein